MVLRNLLFVLLVFASAQCAASDGVIHFSGQVFETTCSVQTGTNSSANSATTLVACSSQVAASAKIVTQVVAPDTHMLVWRANDTTKPDAPVTQWKITEVTYL